MALVSALILVGFFALVALMMVLRRVARVFFALRGKKEDAFERAKCACGYDLSRLDRARCPECGRVRNFDATPEELGLSDEELKRLSEVQQRREREERARLAKQMLK